MNKDLWTLLNTVKLVDVIVTTLLFISILVIVLTIHFHSGYCFNAVEENQNGIGKLEKKKEFRRHRNGFY